MFINVFWLILLSTKFFSGSLKWCRNFWTEDWTQEEGSNWSLYLIQMYFGIFHSRSRNHSFYYYSVHLSFALIIFIIQKKG